MRKDVPARWQGSVRQEHSVEASGRDLRGRGLLPGTRWPRTDGGPAAADVALMPYRRRDPVPVPCDSDPPVRPSSRLSTAGLRTPCAQIGTSIPGAADLCTSDVGSTSIVEIAAPSPLVAESGASAVGIDPLDPHHVALDSSSARCRRLASWSLGATPPATTNPTPARGRLGVVAVTP